MTFGGLEQVEATGKNDTSVNLPNLPNFLQLAFEVNFDGTKVGAGATVANPTF